MAKRNTSRTSRFLGSFFRPRGLAVVLILIALAWVGLGFGQKIHTTYRLNAEAQALQRDNDRIAETNRGYAQQLDALSRPDGAEEQLRQHSYTRPEENRYVVALPSPTPLPAPAAAKTSDSGGGFWGAFWNFVSSPFHR